MGRRSAKKSAKKANAAAAEQSRLNEELLAEQGTAADAESQRIFDATKPMEQVAQVEFGLGSGRQGSNYSDFSQGFGASDDEEEAGAAAAKMEDSFFSMYGFHTLNGTQ